MRFSQDKDWLAGTPDLSFLAEQEAQEGWQYEVSSMFAMVVISEGRR